MDEYNAENEEMLPSYDEAFEVLAAPDQKAQAVKELEENYNLAPKTEVKAVPFKVTKITASYSAKKQIRQYEPVEVFMSAEAEVYATDRDEIRKAQKKLFRQTMRMVQTEVRRLNGSNA